MVDMLRINNLIGFGARRQAASPPVIPFPTVGLDLLYTMESITGSTLKDEQGNYDGTIQGTVSQVPGIIGTNAINFPGNSANRVTTGYRTNGGDYTISCWVRVTDTHSWGSCIYGETNGTGDTNGTLMLLFDATLYCGHFKSVAGDWDNVEYDMSAHLNTWTHIVFTREDGEAHKLYINGTLVDTEPCSSVSAPSTFVGDLGANSEYTGNTGSNNAGRPFRGDIDEFYIYDRTLNEAEIIHLYNERIADLTRGLLAYWRMDDNTSPQPDLSPNGHDATILGSPPVVQGLFGNALHFGPRVGGSTELVSTITPAPTDGDIRTVSLWLKFDAESIAIAQAICYFGTRVGSHPFSVLGLYYSGDNKFGINTWNADIYGFISSFNAGQWYHIVAEIHVGPTHYTNSRIWVDGVSQTMTQLNGTYADATLSSNFQIGQPGSSTETNQKLDGVVDEVRIYDRSLSAQQRAALFNKPLTRFLSFTMDNVDGSSVIPEVGTLPINLHGATAANGVLESIGPTQYASIDDFGTWLAGRSEFTVAMTLRPTPTSEKEGQGYDFAVGTPSHVNPFYRLAIWFQPDAIYFIFNNITANVGFFSIENQNFDVNQTYTFVVRFSNGQIELRLDDVVIAASGAHSSTVGSCHADAMFGRIPALNSAANASAFWVGDFVAYPARITDEQATALYNSIAPTELTDYEAFYSFATDATDASGNHNGTLQNGASVTNGRLALDGNNDLCLTGGTWGATSTFTVSIVVNIGAVTNRQYFFGDYDAGGSNATTRVALGITGNNWEVTIGDGTNFLFETSRPHNLSSNTDYVIQYTYDGTDLRIYVDGVLVQTYTPTFSTSTASPNSWVIGSPGSNALLGGETRRFGGTIKNVYRFHRLLTGAELNALRLAST